MACVAWDSLTQSKDKGGLGIREIQSFNEALLAKLSWRLINNQTSLLSRMLLVKYCRNKPFMEIDPKPSSSHGWKGILVGRDLLKQGLGVAIGNGQTTNVWRDPWTTSIAPGITTGPAPLQHAHTTVADLIDENTKEWKVEEVKNIFPAIWTEILQLRPRKSNATDKPIWMHTKDGIYSTKSDYYKAMENRSQEQRENLPQGFAWKKDIWNIKCPPKIHMLLWRAARGTLPVGTNLMRRKVTPTVSCSRCGGEESEQHLFFHCPFAREVWCKAPLQAALNVDSIPDLKTGITMCNKLQQQLSSTTDRAISAPWILWSLCSSRNKKIFDNRLISEEETIQLAASAEEEWKMAQVEKEVTQPRVQQVSTGPNTRQGPEHEDQPTGTLICQTDAAWSEQTKNAGLGWIVLHQNREIKTRHYK